MRTLLVYKALATTLAVREGLEPPSRLIDRHISNVIQYHYGNAPYFVTTTYQPCVKPKANYNHTKTYPKDFVKLCSLNIALSALHKIKLWILNLNLWALFFELYSTTHIFAEYSPNWAISLLGLRRNRTADTSVCYVCESIQISSLLDSSVSVYETNISPSNFADFFLFA